MQNDQPITLVSPPWKLRGTIYMVSFWSKPGVVPDFAYSSLEGSSPFADPEASGKHRGGLSQFQVIRYTESPVGPYDELIICPGFFDYQRAEQGVVKTKKNARITRIYVSQKYTCWNGRKNWCIPKHLARFAFDELPDGSTKVQVFPHDMGSDETETHASETRLFQATIRPMRWVPSFPLSLSWLKYVGVDASLVQPPLPAGKGSQGELPGTDKWCQIMPGQSSKKASLAWVDLSQKDEKGIVPGQHANFWPGLGQWQLGLKLDNCDIEFGEGIYWETPRQRL